MEQPLRTTEDEPRDAAQIARSSVRDIVPALDIAARSVLESQALGGTVASLVAERALDHHWQGLYQYAAIRVGCELACELLERLEQESEQELRDLLERAPAARALLYRRMRELVRDGRGVPLAPNAAVFFAPADERYRGRLIDLRRTLAPGEAELLELRYARRLPLLELASVLERDPSVLERTLATCLARAERRFGRRPPSCDRSLEGALLEAFAFDPRQGRAPRRRLRPPVLERGAVIAERYEIEEPLGSGAFAEVYRARDRDVVDRVVALKILRTPAADEHSVRSALRELQLIASVFHPSVVTLKDHGWHERRLWFVMPLYRGETLASRLQRGALGRREARAIFEPLAEALATMHRAGVLHQDIKPENVLLATLDPDPEAGALDTPGRILPVLLDLGVAAKDAELVLAGTPAYFAPEVAARFAGAPDPAPVGPKADVFSLALTLRRALDPEAVESAAAASVDAFVVFRAAHAPAPPARRELRDLEPLFARWLHFSPDRRPSAEELRVELAALTRPAERRARRWSLMRWVLPTAVALVALFGAVVYVLSHEAAIQRVEAAEARERAARARERAASMYQTLTVQQARRRQLEADVARLEREYQSSRMTREQLASRLALAEGELEIMKAAQAQRAQKQADDLDELRQQRTDLLAELEAASERRGELGTRLERVESQLAGERAHRSALEAEAERLRQALSAAHAEFEAARGRERELEARLSALRHMFVVPTSTRSRSRLAQ